MINRLLTMMFIAGSILSASDVVINVAKQTTGKTPVYEFTVVNNSKFPISTIYLGNHTKDENEDCPDFKYATQVKCPSGWNYEEDFVCETSYGLFFFIKEGENVDNFKKHLIQPGTSLSGISLERKYKEMGAKDEFMNCRFTVKLIKNTSGEIPKGNGYQYGVVTVDNRRKK